MNKKQLVAILIYLPVLGGFSVLPSRGDRLGASISFSHGFLDATVEEADKFIDYLCASSQHEAIYFAWRPQLADPDNEFILELAVAAGASHIVTFNQSDFRGAQRAHLAFLRITLTNQKIFGRRGSARPTMDKVVGRCCRNTLIFSTHPPRSIAGVQKARCGHRSDFDAFLAKVPDVPALPGDEISES